MATVLMLMLGMAGMMRRVVGCQFLALNVVLVVVAFMSLVAAVVVLVMLLVVVVVSVYIVATMDTNPMSKSEGKEYYRLIWQEGAKTGLAGVMLGLAATAGLQRFHPAFRQLPLFIKSTLVIYPGLIMTSMSANSAFHRYQSRLHPALRRYEDEVQRAAARAHARETETQKGKDWIYDHRLQVLGGTWATVMAACLEGMRRDHYTTAARKIVQARVVAQATTLAVLLILAALEAKDKSEGRGKYQPIVVVREEDWIER
ncbi:hypothetical protein QBC34DRAFT_499360 [Podospora aff. communis PSN243]|uniref:HIG1 domain-containing protein n=1 Tax=Podospora aff. communis PSN243 TaxID=3040156 RepID=A0AAV9G611_9PEZI|nr:hypothetical protein QBC34DRAFT_499360 [Podospora aff. communis PSN243]